MQCSVSEGRASEGRANTAGKRVKNNYFDGYPISRKQLFLMFVMIFGVFFEQIDNQLTSFVGPNVMSSLEVGNAEWALMGSVTLAGMCLGGICGGYVSDGIGRKKAFLGSLLLVTLMATLCGLTADFALFLVFRFFQGIGVMAMTVVFVIYLLEITPAEQRGRWEGVCAGLGYVAIPFIGLVATAVLPLHPEAWRVLFIASLGALVPFGIGVALLPESPRWLVSKGRVREAERSVYALIKQDIDLSDAYARAMGETSRSLTGLSALKRLFTTYRKRTIVLFLVCIANTAPFALMTQWNNILLQEMGLMQEASLLITTIGTFGAPLGCLLGAWIGPKGGRRLAIAGVFVVEIASFLFYVFVATTLTQDVRVLGSLYLVSQVFGNCALICCNPYFGESYPTEVRTFASGTIHSVGRLATAGVMGFVPAVVGAAGFAGMGVLSSGIILVGVVTVLGWGWPTGKKPLEEVLSSGSDNTES